MIIKLLFLFLISTTARAQLYPDKTLTPGKTTEISEAKLCKVGYTKDVRFVSLATKKEVFKRYGIPWSKHAKYEVDHAVTDKTAQAVDCNTDKTRKRAGVVPGAILISDHEGYAAGELPADKTMRLVFYCANPG